MALRRSTVSALPTLVLAIAAGSARVRAADSPDLSVCTAHYRADAIEFAGSTHALVRNHSQGPVHLQDIALDGTSIGKVWPSDASFLNAEVRAAYIQVSDPGSAWYRVYPNPIQPGGVSEIVIRLTTASRGPTQHTLRLKTESNAGLSIAIPTDPPSVALDYVGLDAQLATLHVYALVTDATPEPLRVRIDGGPPPPCTVWAGVGATRNSR